MFKKIEISDLDSMEIIDGQLRNLTGPSFGELVIYLERNKKIYTLAHTGTWINPEDFSKYSKIYYKQIINPNIYENFITAISGIKNSLDSQTYLDQSKKFIQLWERTYVEDKTESFWCYLLALHECLYPKEIIELQKLSEFAIPIYFRSFYLSGMAFYLALKNGIYDFGMLKDIFLVSLSLDTGLAFQHFHYNMYVALEKDRIKNGDGLKFLKEANHSELEIQFYQHHPVVGYSIFKKEFANYLINERLADLIKIHHEGEVSSYPLELLKYECDEIEQIIILLNRSIPYIEIDQISPAQVLEQFSKYLIEAKLSYLKAVG